jgi:hypothetical protein
MSRARNQIWGFGYATDVGHQRDPRAGHIDPVGGTLGLGLSTYDTNTGTVQVGGQSNPSTIPLGGQANTSITPAINQPTK